MSETKTEQQTSDFGQGLCYCLGLFIAHQADLHHTLDLYADIRKKKEVGDDIFTESRAVGHWFCGAADHMFDLIPDSAPDHLVSRVLSLKNKCLSWRLSMGNEKEPTLDNALWAIQEAKNLLREIDAHHGVPVIKGSWE